MGHIHKKIQNTEHQYYNQCGNNYTLAATEGKEILKHGIGFMPPENIEVNRSISEIFLYK